MSKCLKCGNEIPCRVKINGVYHILSNRKYCLMCSPFGQHNTRQLSQDIVITKGKNNSTKNKAQAVQRRRHLLKKRAVDYKGGQCAICGYKKYLGALEFHHINPAEKDFAIGSKTVAWETIRRELDKCVLVCSNCHKELEAGLIEIPVDVCMRNPNYTDESYIYHSETVTKINYCKDCGKVITSRAKYCMDCKYKHFRFYKRPSKEQLLQDLQYTTILSKIAKQYGVSDSTVKRWCDFYNITIQKI